MILGPWGTILQMQVVFPAIKGFPESDNHFPAVSPGQSVSVVGMECLFFHMYNGTGSCSSREQKAANTKYNSYSITTLSVCLEEKLSES